MASNIWEQINKKRLAIFYDKEPIFYEDVQLPYFREKLTSLSEHVLEIKSASEGVPHMLCSIFYLKMTMVLTIVI